MARMISALVPDPARAVSMAAGAVPAVHVLCVRPGPRAHLAEDSAPVVPAVLAPAAGPAASAVWAAAPLAAGEAAAEDKQRAESF